MLKSSIFQIVHSHKWPIRESEIDSNIEFEMIFEFDMDLDFELDSGLNWN